MNIEQHRKIQNTSLYIDSLINNHISAPAFYVKKAYISARPGIPGERIVTVVKTAFEETVNTVGYDPETGVPDWVATAQTGEMYIIHDREFQKKYQQVPDKPGLYQPTGKPVAAIRIPENIVIQAPWGEAEYIRAGGYLIMADVNDIYGVSEEEFLTSYERVSSFGNNDNNVKEAGD